MSSFAINYLRLHGERSGDVMDRAEFERTLNSAVGIWIILSIVNSLYSLYWDVAVDWALTQPPKTFSSRTLIPHYLRRHLHFPRWVYHAAVVLDTLLRLTWTFKVALLYTLVRATVYDDPMPSSVGLDVALKVAEVLRRWMWVFLRVEREWVERKWGGDDGEGEEVAGLVEKGSWRSREREDDVASPMKLGRD
ncbi:protein-ER retention protein [Rhizophlyctis rosea]|nr:protein-ER retention protein [Rhizophlyctis rosea]